LLFSGQIFSAPPVKYLPVRLCLYVNVLSCVVTYLELYVSVFSCVVTYLELYVSVLSCVVRHLELYVNVLSCVVTYLELHVSVLSHVVACLELFSFLRRYQLMKTQNNVQSTRLNLESLGYVKKEKKSPLTVNKTSVRFQDEPKRTQKCDEAILSGKSRAQCVMIFLYFANAHHSPIYTFRQGCSSTMRTSSLKLQKISRLYKCQKILKMETTSYSIKCIQ